jgi:hypothetical protein
MKFLKLSQRMINVNYISYVKFSHTDITIWLETHNLSGLVIFGIGGIGNIGHELNYNVESDKDDFKIINDWISNK